MGWEAARASAGGRAGRAWARPALGPCQYFGRGRSRRWEVASRGAADARAGDSCTEQAFGQAVKRREPARGRKRPVRNEVRRARFRQKEELAARDGVRGAATGPIWTGRCGLTPRYVRNGYPRGVRIGGGGGNLLIYKAFSVPKRVPGEAGRTKDASGACGSQSRPQEPTLPEVRRKATGTPFRLSRPRSVRIGTNSLSTENRSQSAS